MIETNKVQSPLGNKAATGLHCFIRNFIAFDGDSLRRFLASSY